MGGKLGRIFARAGHEVTFSYARSKDKLKKLASGAQGNARAGTPAEAAKDADALLLAVNWPRIDDVLKQADDLSGKVIVTCSLPMDPGNTGLVIAHTSSGAEELAKKVAGAKVVSAFHTVPSEVLFGVFEARRKSTRPSLVYSGDDRSANSVAAELIRDAGFDPVDAGPLQTAPIHRAVRVAHRTTGVRRTRGSGTGLSIRAVQEIGNPNNKTIEGGIYRLWRLDELARNLPPRDRQSGSLAQYASILFSRRLSRRLFKGPASLSSQVRGPHGIRIHLVRPSSLLPAAAGCSAKADRSKRSGRVMWSGSSPARSTGTAPHQLP